MRNVYKALEDCGILRKVKRIAGSSAGAICGALLAVGFTPQEIATVWSGDNDYVKWIFQGMHTFCSFGLLITIPFKAYKPIKTV